MAYFKHRRTQEPYQPTFRQHQAQDDDVVYTEEDYAASPDDPAWQEEWAAQNEAFLPDDADYAPAVAYDDDADFTGNDDFTDTDDFSDLLDGDPLADDLLTDEEREELHQSRWRLIAGLGDLAGVIIGVGVILLMVMLLISLLNWLAADIVQTFTLWQANM